MYDRNNWFHRSTHYWRPSEFHYHRRPMSSSQLPHSFPLARSVPHQQEKCDEGQSKSRSIVGGRHSVIIIGHTLTTFPSSLPVSSCARACYFLLLPKQQLFSYQLQWTRLEETKRVGWEYHDETAALPHSSSSLAVWLGVQRGTHGSLYATDFT